MPPLPLPAEEALAHALAMGLSRSAASTEAGFARAWKRGRERAARPQIVARARALDEARQWEEACEASEMIRALMRLAGEAGRMRTAAAMVAARGLVAEAAKLNQRTFEPPEAPQMATDDTERFRPLSKEAWIAKYGHLA